MANKKNVPRWLQLPYAAWACTVFLLLGLTVLLLILPVPSLAWRRRMVRGAARLVLWACGLRMRVRHLKCLPPGACVVVANHASYLDGVVLFAALPPRFGFVIKREVSKLPLASLLLRRIGSHFVARDSGHKGARDTRRLLKRAHTGDALAFFPEGTFQLRPGLAAFRSGAFAIAAKTGLPIVPVAIRGTRAALPANSFMPWPGRISVELAPALAPPASTSPEELGAARRAARRAILARIDEPDLAPQD